VYDEATDAALRAALGPFAALIGATTTDIQRLMTDLGYYTGRIDGIWTEELSDAIRALQRDLGVPETGVLDAATLRAVYARGVETGSTTTTTVPPTTVVPSTAPPPTTAPPTTAPPTTAPPTTTPPPDPQLPTLREALAADGRFTGYLRLLDAAAFPTDVDVLAASTLFAPTDDALDAAGVVVDDLIAAESPEDLFVLVAGTAANGRLSSAFLSDPANSPLTMVGGEEYALATDASGNLTIDGSTIEGPEIEAYNGIIHAVTRLV
jgi:hypothetical protein